MRTPTLALAVFLVVTAAVLLPRLAWVVLDTYALGHPDGKFGAAGGIKFAAVVFGIAAVSGGAVCAALIALRTSLWAVRNTRAVLTWALGGGLVLSLLSGWIPKLAAHGVGHSLFGDIGTVIVNWIVICAVVFVAGLLAMRRQLAA